MPAKFFLGGLGIVFFQVFADQAAYLGTEQVIEQAVEMGFGGDDEALVLVAGAALFYVVCYFPGEQFVFVLLWV